MSRGTNHSGTTGKASGRKSGKTTTGRKNPGTVVRSATTGRFLKASTTKNPKTVVSEKPPRNGAVTSGRGHSPSLPTERMVPISEARANLSALIKRAADGDLFLMNHGKPAAVLMSPDHYQALLDELDDLQDRLAVWENADAPAVPFEQLLAELGDDSDSRSVVGPGAAAIGRQPVDMGDVV